MAKAPQRAGGIHGCSKGSAAGGKLLCHLWPQIPSRPPAPSQSVPSLLSSLPWRCFKYACSFSHKPHKSQGKTQAFTSNAEFQTTVINCLTIINSTECPNFPKYNVELTSITSGSLAAPSVNHGSDVLLEASVLTLLLVMTV